MGGLDPPIQGSCILVRGIQLRAVAAMDYAKFLGLSIVAVLIFVLAIYGAAFALNGVATALGVTAYLLLALLAASLVFAVANPRHLRLGYAIWVVAIYLVNLATQEYIDFAVKQNPSVSPKAIWFYNFNWELVAIAALNPVCYLLGKYVWKRFARADTAKLPT